MTQDGYLYICAIQHVLILSKLFLTIGILKIPQASEIVSFLLRVSLFFHTMTYYGDFNFYILYALIINIL